MPHISVAMAASLRRGMLENRSIISQAEGVKSTFSSWSNCMAKTYCKWPIIAAIIVASLIVLSVVACIIRCACCGLSCCCTCFSCLKCCGDCCGCCDDPKGRKHKHLDDDYATPFAPQTGYKPPMPMMAGGIGASGPPQYAQFETGPNGLAVEPKVVNEDALPPMPSWEAAQKKRIAQEEADAVEMGELDPATGQKIPLMSGAGPISRSNSPGHSPSEHPYGDRPGMNQDASYIGTGGAAVGEGALGAGAMAIDGRTNDRYGNVRGTPMDNRGGYGSGRGGYPSGPGRGYDSQYNNQFSYSGSNTNNNGNFAPIPAGTYPSRGPLQRQYTDSNAGSNTPSRPYANERQYSEVSSQFANPSYPSVTGTYSDNNSRRSPPPNSNSGFDFGGSAGPSPPQQQSYGSSQQGRGGNYAPSTTYPSSVAPSMPPSYRTNSPPPQEEGYSRYQAYGAPSSRQQGGGRGGPPPSSLMPGPRGGGGGQREYGGY